MSAFSSGDPLRRGRWWTVTSYLVTALFGFVAWVYFFVLNRTRIVRPYRGTDRPNLMFVANHQSPVDTALIVLAAFSPRALFRRRLQPWSVAAADYWFRGRVTAWLADRLRCLPARAGLRDGGTVRSLCRVLPTGTTVFFPEGKRSPDGVIGPARPGAGFVALETGARIVPVAIHGLLDAMPHRRPWPRIGRTLAIAFGDPVAYGDLAAAGSAPPRETARRIVARSMDAVEGLHRSLMAGAGARARVRRRPGNVFDGKVVWVTGASSGIGRALALALHRRSATVILSSRNRVGLEEVARQCDGDAPIHVLPLDLTDEAGIPEAVHAALSVAGHVDYVVHNAGIAARGAAADTDLKVHRRVMDTNYFGPVALTKAILPSMMRRKRGTFVVISSIVGRFGASRVGAYAASKHALHGFFESLRAEVRQDNIRVCMVLPGFVNTAITLNALTASGAPYGRRMRVHLEGMSPEDCARRILAGVAAGRRELVMGGLEALSVPLLRVSRRLVAFLVRHYPFRVPDGLWRVVARGGDRPLAERAARDSLPVSW
jgi:dehydrogenase/reductase SDR family protein 7B